MADTYHCEIRELSLRDPFGISRGVRRTVRNLVVNVGDGWGEGAPVDYRGQSVDEMLDLAREWLSGCPDLSRPIEVVVSELLERYPGQSAVAEAIDLALHDAWGKAAGKPLYQLWGLSWKDHPVSSFTIGMDSLDSVMRKVERAEAYPVLKVKVGGAGDLEAIAEIHRTVGKTLYVDANEGWTVEQTLEYLPQLCEWNVRLLEQPLSSEDIDGYRRIRENNRTGIPIIQDEGVHGPEDVLSWAGIVDGINIKLAKCGGLARARQMIDLARQNNLLVMLGCMIESSLGVTAAAHLAPMVDYLDLDGAALLSDDPFDGMKLEKGRLVMPNRPGIGAVLNE